MVVYSGKSPVLHKKKHNLNLAQYMIVCSTVFNTENINFMASHCKRLPDDSIGLIEINQVLKTYNGITWCGI